MDSGAVSGCGAASNDGRERGEQVAFTWLDKYSEALWQIDDVEMRKELVYAMVQFGTTGEEAELPFPWSVVFASFKEDIAFSCNRHAAGARGGRAKQARQRARDEGETATSSSSQTATLASYSSQSKAKQSKASIKDKLSGEPDESDAVPYAEIISILNDELGTAFRSTAKSTRGLIHARWMEGYRIEDFRDVIAFKKFEWGGDQKMSQYLRPSTLFGTKFEGYLQAAHKSAVVTEEEQTDDFYAYF